MDNRIKAIRKSRNITQHKISMLLDLPQPRISDIERGKRRIKLDEAQKVAKYLQCRIEDLIVE